ncbi:MULTISPECIES: ArsI/CadI family heavy metal resistance metalloenzyme [Brevibacillus]|uniref:ArsI/CadI family heavy metal resistance metalloenzyme n=1 Tax=Brevibacillus TaxID=55080 RepID=UPI00156B9240|nr:MULTISPECIES: ArsI/CadI family heavy metal resistance metalloenzyme [Brevibacillus]MDR4998897.1 ArsI/CadI family heavy metal resistance metalloenzyme [Brevibacillus parabrevis]MED2254538.1 ArsI/CadI family heavy metal resistance metalloenzyme [Brevibacillus parabrevis]UED67478.1 VOC family protein [Brevibacillus sp. HD3.3A]WDV93728.1 ArsI/CadI family heavy metal resistance metalloenzyme [Brevibacillus parabrevis]
MLYAHIGINVTNLEKSIAFYSKLFDAEPVKVKPDYAKFLLSSPALNFTLNVSREVTGNQVSHFGFQVASTEDVLIHKTRLEKRNLFSNKDERNITCCYATQDKFWVHDPDGNEWEFFYTKADADTHREIAAVCCTPESENGNGETKSCC